MAIAVDTNIIRPVLAGVKPADQILATLLTAYNTSDGLVLCAPVYAELLAGPGASVEALDAFLQGTGITVDFALSPIVWRDAGIAFGSYAERRLASPCLFRYVAAPHPCRLRYRRACVASCDSPPDAQ